MEAIFAYLLVGSFICMLITFALAGLAWGLSAITFIFLLIVAPFMLLAYLFTNKRDNQEPQKKAIIAYHQMKYGIMENSRK
ncbi:hypothetical protein [Mannheimia granulomatis]|uniref:hypothetical protein n=1 Tax=Mannheimia granulomatis TaxID=85402 RepID=UPI00047D745A|nr:hypothetical protein [Mannheimia granulomatis]QLB18841.1 hypothetical protein A6B41_04970 [Mannheimia granulomatis]